MGFGRRMGIWVWMALVVGGLAAGPAVATPSYGFVGLQIQGTDEGRVAEALGIESDQGVIVLDVAPHGPGAEAGIRQGDLILTFNGKPVNYTGIVQGIQKVKPGESFEVTVRRGDKTLDLKVISGEWPASWDIRRGAFASLPKYGVTLSSLTQKLRQQFGIPWGITGVLVTIVNTVKKDDEVSLARSDVIVQVNSQNVWVPQHVSQLVDQAKAAGKKYAVLLVYRTSGYHLMLLPVR